jgi:NAD(P)-dependent dehydrogenase (short-subunit alcohol dehydrogenase family)
MSEQTAEVVVVTGASAGVGRATVQEFARHGAHIGMIARGQAGLEAARRDVEELGGKAIVVPCDVSDAAALEDAADRVEREFGPIDIWVNDAMTTVFSPVKEMTADEYRRVTEVTYLGFVNGTLAALHRMLPRDHGTIVQVGSALAYRAIPLQSAYCASKHAMLGFTTALRTELLHDGSNVTVTMVHMPALNTPQFSWCKTRMPRKPQPVPPIYQPEVAARAIYWAAHHKRRELFVGIPTALTIELNKLFPRLADRYLARTGYSGQQYDGNVDPDRPVDLWEPADANRDFGAHGAFDDRAHDRSFQLWLSTHRSILGLAGAAVGVGTALIRLRRHDAGDLVERWMREAASLVR